MKKIEPVGRVHINYQGAWASLVGNVKEDEPLYTERQLQDHAALVRAEYRKELLAGVGEPRTLSRGDEDGPLQLGYTADQLAAAVLREREACAKVCEGRIGGAVQANEWWGGFRDAMRQCAAAIRARKGDAA